MIRLVTKSALRASDNGEPIESMFVPKGTVLTIGEWRRREDFRGRLWFDRLADTTSGSGLLTF